MAKSPSDNLFELSGADLQELVKHGMERKYKRGDALFEEGDEVESIYLVKEGRIHMTKSSADGTESMVAFYQPGQTFCVAASIMKDPYPCKAVAATDSTVVSIPDSRFKNLFEKLPSFAKRLLTDMAPQFCEAHCDCALAVESVDKRLAHTLLRLDRQFEGGDIPFTRQELAQMVNTTVETCIRVLSDWDKKGWVSGNRGKMRLSNREAIEDLTA